MAVTFFTELCNHHHDVIVERVYHRPEKLRPHSRPAHPLLPSARPRICFLSPRLYLLWALPIHGTLQYMHGLWVWLLSLSAMFPESLRLYHRFFIPFCGQITLCCMDTPRFLSPFISWRTPGCSRYLAYE